MSPLDSRALARNARTEALRMVHRAKASHIGSALSMIDVLAVLYADVLRIPHPRHEDRDRLIVSKGHAAVGLYAVLAECGLLDRAELETYGQEGSRLLGHVSHHVPGVEMSTGALGHGLSVGCGIALARRDVRVVVVCGDGEMQEGAIWEALLFGAHHGLKNLTLVVDANGQQGLGRVQDVLGLGSLGAKLWAFGWQVREVDGHDHDSLRRALSEVADGPLAIVAKTTKGKGVSFMEDELAWHYRSPGDEDLRRALKEIEA